MLGVLFCLLVVCGPANAEDAIPLSVDQRIRGIIEPTDPIGRSGLAYVDRYSFIGEEGQEISIGL
jgi:hypothetical protein